MFFCSDLFQKITFHQSWYMHKLLYDLIYKSCPCIVYVILCRDKTFGEKLKILQDKDSPLLSADLNVRLELLLYLFDD